MTTTSDPFADGKPREISVTCAFCGHSQKTWTRRGIRFTCRKCGRVQEGPTGTRRLADRLHPAAPPPAAPATTVKIVSAKVGAHKSPAVKTSKAAIQIPAAPKVNTPPAPAPAPPRKDWLSKALGFQ